MKVIIPQKTGVAQIGIDAAKKQKDKYPVLYLLHGMSDDYSTWTRRTSLERYVSKLPLVVVMPSGGRSHYTDMASGPLYWTFISEELPRIVKSFFPVSDRREDTFAAGNSMGGYGALKLALRKPDKFSAAGGFSGALCLDWMKSSDTRAVEAEKIFGKKPKPCDDLMKISSELARSSKPKPKLYQGCGTEDFLYKYNIKFKNHVEKLGYKLTYAERPGLHEWGFWDQEIQNFLKWLPIKSY